MTPPTGSSATSRYSLRNRNSDGQVDKQQSPFESSSAPHAPAPTKKPLKKLVKKPQSVDDNAEFEDQGSAMSQISQRASEKKPEPEPITGKRKRRGAFSVSEGNVSNERDVPQVAQDANETSLIERPGRFSREVLKAFLTRHFHTAHCHHCHETLPLEQELEVHLQHWTSAHRFHTDVSPSAIPCPSFECNATTCLGCGTQSQKGDGTKASEAVVCCDESWYTSLWLFLAYFDKQKRPRPVENVVKIKEEDESVSPSSKSKKAKSKKSKASHNPIPPKGTGYNDGHHFQDHYPDYHSDVAPPGGESARSSSRKQEEVRAKGDRREAALMTNIAQLVMQMPGGGDVTLAAQTNSRKSRKTGKGKVAKQPSDTQSGMLLVLSMFHWSTILQSIVELFRNDSVEEAFKRVEIYTAAIELVAALARTASTIPLVKDRTYNAPRALHDHAPAKLCAELEYQPVQRTAIEDFEGQSIADSMGNLNGAARALHEAATAMPHVYNDKASKDLLDFCRRINSVGEALDKADDCQAEPSSKPRSRGSSQDFQSKFEVVEEEAITASYRFKDKMRFTQATAPKRMRSLFYDVGILRTSLPDGIHVRVANNRPDVIKALIVGPDDTPYQGGLFEFDILCPESYPNQPPSVECATASREEARMVHLNPNLYTSGYVCLSLIGTWHGSREEQWQPNRSTLLQLLISIQSMILGTATPADNEPGGLSTPHSEFNKGIQAGTIQAALLPWLRNTQLRSGLWKDVVEKHFKDNASTIMATAKDWTRGNDRIKKWSSSSHYAHFADHGSPMPEDASNEAAEYVPQNMEPDTTAVGLQSLWPTHLSMAHHHNPAYGWPTPLPAGTSLTGTFPPPPPGSGPHAPQGYHDGPPPGHWEPDGFVYKPSSTSGTATAATDKNKPTPHKTPTAGKATSEPPLPPAPTKPGVNSEIPTSDTMSVALKKSLEHTSAKKVGGLGPQAASDKVPISSIVNHYKELTKVNSAASNKAVSGSNTTSTYGDNSAASMAAVANALTTHGAYDYGSMDGAPISPVSCRRDSKRPPKIQTVNLCEELETALAEYL